MDGTKIESSSSPTLILSQKSRRTPRKSKGSNHAMPSVQSSHTARSNSMKKTSKYHNIPKPASTSMVIEELSPSQESFINKKILAGFKLYKKWEQRQIDFQDSKVGLETWQMGSRGTASLSWKENETISMENEEDEKYEDLLDEELISLLKTQNVNDLNRKEFLSFGVLWAIIDFIYSYFSDTFQFALIKIALTTQPSIITQNLNEAWNVPKLLKEDLTVYVKDLADKYKRIPVKKPKEKKEKQKKVKPEKEKKEKPVKEKKIKLSKEEKAALKAAEKLLKKQMAEEEERKLKELMNKIFLFPLQDAAPDDAFFKEKFKNFKRLNLKKGKKKK